MWGSEALQRTGRGLTRSQGLPETAWRPQLSSSSSQGVWRQLSLQTCCLMGILDTTFKTRVLLPKLWPLGLKDEEVGPPLSYAITPPLNAHWSLNITISHSEHHTTASAVHPIMHPFHFTGVCPLLL